MSERKVQVLIAGAGPNGLALACLLAQQGVSCRIVDKNAERSRTSKAIGLQYRVSELLAQMGVVDRFLEAGASATPVNMYEGGRKLVRLKFDLGNDLAGRDAFVPAPIILPQSETERILAQRLGELGQRVEWNTELVSFRQNVGGVLSILRCGGREKVVASDYLVSCEGAHSRIRKLAGMNFIGKTYPLTFVLADVKVDWALNRAENHVWFHRDGAFAALPLPRDGTWRLFFEISREARGCVDEVTIDKVRSLYAARTGNSDACIHDPTWLSVFRINCRIVDRYRQGRVFVAGDAAHIHSPTGGQGITTGLQDVANLAWKLGRVVNGAPDALLDSYEQERLPKAKEVLRETDRTTTLFFSKNPFVRVLRDAVVLPILRLPIVQRKMFHKLAQLHVNYRGSSLSVQAQRSGPFGLSRLKAGDRAPDVALFQANTGREVTLFQLLSEFRPILLVGTERGVALSAAARRALRATDRLDIRSFVVTTTSGPGSDRFTELVDIHGDLKKLYGLTDDFACLIRPDGHIGLIQKPMCAEGLEQYFKMICDPAAVVRAIEVATAEPLPLERIKTKTVVETASQTF